MLRVVLIDPKTKRSLHVEEPYNGFEAVEESALIPVVINPLQVHGTFRSATRVEAGTTVITIPSPGGSIILTDLLISGEKQAGSTTEIRFSDGTNNETIFKAYAVTVPPAVNHSFVGRIQGWKDACLEMITVGTADSTIMIGSMKVSSSLEFAEWDGLR